MNYKLSESANATDFLLLGFSLQQDAEGLTEFSLQTQMFKIVIDAGWDVKLFRVNPDTDGITLQIYDLNDLENLVCWVADEPIHVAEPVGAALCGRPNQASENTKQENENQPHDYLNEDLITEPYNVNIETKLADGKTYYIGVGDILHFRGHEGFLMDYGKILMVWIAEYACLGYLEEFRYDFHPLTEHDEPHEDIFAYCDYVGHYNDEPELQGLFLSKE